MPHVISSLPHSQALLLVCPCWQEWLGIDGLGLRIGDAKESLSSSFSYQRLNVKNDTYMCRQVRQWLSLWARNGSSDGIDAFVTAVLNTGFGSGEEAAQVEVLQRIFPGSAS